jgi:hypothetical protein
MKKLTRKNAAFTTMRQREIHFSELIGTLG